jgi:hypothetical protein
LSDEKIDRLKQDRMTNNTTGYRELTASVSKQLGTLCVDKPDLMKAFGDLAKAAARDGALDKMHDRGTCPHR